MTMQYAAAIDSAGRISTERSTTEKQAKNAMA